MFTNKKVFQETYDKFFLVRPEHTAIEVGRDEKMADIATKITLDNLSLWEVNDTGEQFMAVACRKNHHAKHDITYKVVPKGVLLDLYSRDDRYKRHYGEALGLFNRRFVKMRDGRCVWECFVPDSVAKNLYGINPERIMAHYKVLKSGKIPFVVADANAVQKAVRDAYDAMFVQPASPRVQNIDLGRAARHVLDMSPIPPEMLNTVRNPETGEQWHDLEKLSARRKRDEFAYRSLFMQCRNKLIGDKHLYHVMHKNGIDKPLDTPQFVGLAMLGQGKASSVSMAQMLDMWNAMRDSKKGGGSTSNSDVLLLVDEKTADLEKRMAHAAPVFPSDNVLVLENGNTSGTSNVHAGSKRKATKDATREGSASGTKEGNASGSKEDSASGSKEDSASGSKEDSASGTKGDSASGTKEDSASGTGDDRAGSKKKPKDSAEPHHAIAACVDRFYRQAYDRDLEPLFLQKLFSGITTSDGISLRMEEDPAFRSIVHDVMLPYHHMLWRYYKNNDKVHEKKKKAMAQHILATSGKSASRQK